MVSIIFGAVLCLIGVLTATQHPVGMGDIHAKFTDKSIKKFLPLAGVCEIIAGIGSIVEGVFEGNTDMQFIGWIIGLVAVGAFVLLWKNVLVKKK